MPVRAPPAIPGLVPPCWIVSCGVCGVVRIVGVQQPAQPLATHAGIIVGQKPMGWVMHGWHDIGGICVWHGMKIDGGHGWHETGGCCVGQGMTYDGITVVVGHGWHETGGCCVGQGMNCEGIAVGVGHGWHETGGCCVWHGTKSDGGQPTVDGHGWHETIGGREQKCEGGQNSGAAVGQGWHETAGGREGMHSSGACVGHPSWVGAGCGGCGSAGFPLSPDP